MELVPKNGNNRPLSLLLENFSPSVSLTPRGFGLLASWIMSWRGCYRVLGVDEVCLGKELSTFGGSSFHTWVMVKSFLSSDPTIVPSSTDDRSPPGSPNLRGQ